MPAGLARQALDDPIAPEHAIPYSAFAENELLALLTTSTGECDLPVLHSCTL
jgi:hypothetical protein